MRHPTLSAGPLTTAVELLHEDGSTTTTRGRARSDPEDEDTALGSVQRLTVRVPTPANDSRVERVSVAGVEHEALDAARRAPALGSRWDSTTYQLRKV